MDDDKKLSPLRYESLPLRSREDLTGIIRFHFSRHYVAPSTSPKFFGVGCLTKKLLIIPTLNSIKKSAKYRKGFGLKNQLFSQLDKSVNMVV